MESKIPYIFSSINIHPSLATVDLTISTRNTSHTIEKVLWSDVEEFAEDLLGELKTTKQMRDELRKHLSSTQSITEGEE